MCVQLAPVAAWQRGFCKWEFLARRCQVGQGELCEKVWCQQGSAGMQSKICQWSGCMQQPKLLAQSSWMKGTSDSVQISRETIDGHGQTHSEQELTFPKKVGPLSYWLQRLPGGKSKSLRLSRVTGRKTSPYHSKGDAGQHAPEEYQGQHG